jgi:hypothetical protein
VKFDVRHEFPLPLEQVERAVLHPDRIQHTLAALDKIELLEELERKETDAEVFRRVRVRPRYEVPSFAQSAIKREMTEYVEESRYDRRAHRLTYTIHPNIPRAWQDRFVSRGTYSLTETGGRTKRHIEVELVIKVALVGGMAERYIADQVRANFDQEARALEAFARTLSAARG